MKQFEATTVIHASPETIWSILMDTSKYPEWDPYCEKIEGDVAVGSKIKAYSKLNPGRAFPLKVTEASAPAKMTWTGGMPLGLFRGERTFTLTKYGRVTHFELREVFSGPMLGLIQKSIPDMTEAFETFAAGLKARAEAAETRTAA